MRIVAAILAASLMFGCQGPPPENSGQDPTVTILSQDDELAYWRDGRTELCFASIGPVDHRTTTNVPCTELVERYIAVQEMQTEDEVRVGF